jgi:hypothetical protein
MKMEMTYRSYKYENLNKDKFGKLDETEKFIKKAYQ